MHSLFKKRIYGYGHKEKVGKNLSFNMRYPPRTETPFYILQRSPCRSLPATFFMFAPTTPAFPL